MTTPRAAGWPGGLGAHPNRRHPSQDAYRVADHLPTAGPPTRRLWSEGTQLDQKQTGTCVAFSWTADLLAAPIVSHASVAPSLGRNYALNHYRRARVIYGHDPADLHAGTSTESGARVGIERGLYDTYLWAHTLDEIRQAILTRGPIVLTTPWHANMNYTRRDGLVRPIPNAAAPSWHAILVTGYDPARHFDKDDTTREVFRWRNSWGTRYGAVIDPLKGTLSGDGWITAPDLATLIGQGADGIIPTGRHPFNLANLIATHPDPTIA